jgi:hypothetical protein
MKKDEKVGLLLEMEKCVFNDWKDKLRSDFESRVQMAIDDYETKSPEVGTLESTRFRPRGLTTAYGEIRLRLRIGKTSSGGWVSPAAVALGLKPSRRLSPDVERRICTAAVTTGSYDAAHTVLDSNWLAISITAVRNTVERLGAEAIEAPMTGSHRDKAGKDDTLIIMADGWNARHRGEDWGSRRAASEEAEKGKERIHWHEIRSAIMFKLSDLACVSGERREILRKFTTAAPAETSTHDFGLILERDAQRMGLSEAKAVFFVMDGGIWLWNIHEDRFSRCSKGLLDFYHLSEHLHALGAALHPESREEAHRWCGKILHGLKHNSPEKLFATLNELLEEPPSQDPDVIETIRREKAYCEKHKEHMDYAGCKKSGLPIGSGSVESLCSQLQNRLKRTGQFWSKEGFAALLEIIVRYRNRELNSLWAA